MNFWLHKRKRKVCQLLLRSPRIRILLLHLRMPPKGSAKDDPHLSELSEGTEIQMDPEFCVWRDSRIAKIFLLLTAIQRAARILINHAFRQGGGMKNEIGSYLEGIGKWFEILDLGTEKKDVWGSGVASWRPH